MEKIYFNSKDARNLINIYGFSIFPIHGVKADKSCTCSNPNCNNIGKHPATPDGFKSASNDIEHVKKLWAGRNALNVGIATGKPSGVFVIDIDSPEAETELYKTFNIPDTYTVQTGRGKHLYFKYDEQRPVKNGANVIKGVDVRGDGGYVAGAGSNHASGVVYTCDNPLQEFAICPDDLLDFCTSKKTAPLIEQPKQSLFIKTNDGWTLEQVKDHLAHINADIGYDEWVKVGMALHAEGLPFHLFDEWSQKGVKYDNSARDHWKSFSAGGGVTYGTVVAYAKQGGWEFKPKTSTLQAPSITPQDIVNPETGEITPVTTVNKLPLIYAGDVVPSLDAEDFVEDLLCKNQFSVIYGESNCGKTFFMLDLAMHVALGREWRGKEVEQGAVLYAALEGGHGTKNRIVAFKEHYNITDTINLAIIPSSINFLDAEGDIQSLLYAIQEAQAKIGNIKLIVIDTLARAISGGDENSSQDMGQMIIHADMIREMTGAHISFIHHSGKDTVKGARGHSSLRAAVDTEIEISRTDTDSPSVIKVVKQREMEMIEPMGFKLERVELGVNKRNKDITSCVVEPCDIKDKQTVIKLNANETFMYDSIVNCIDKAGVERKILDRQIKSIDYTDLYQNLVERGYKELGLVDEPEPKDIKSSTQTARISLKKKGYINFNKRYVWLNN